MRHGDEAGGALAFREPALAFFFSGRRRERDAGAEHPFCIGLALRVAAFARLAARVRRAGAFLGCPWLVVEGEYLGPALEVCIAESPSSTGRALASTVPASGCTPRMGKDGRGARYGDAGDVGSSRGSPGATPGIFVVVMLAKVVCRVRVVVYGEFRREWSERHMVEVGV